MRRPVITAILILGVLVLSSSNVLQDSDLGRTVRSSESVGAPGSLRALAGWGGAGPEASGAERPSPGSFTVTIYPNGTVEPPTAAVQGSGNSYRITSNFSGTILDERNGSRLDGNGKVLMVPTGAPVGIEVYLAGNIALTGLRISMAPTAILLEDVNGVSVSGANLNSSAWALDFENCTGVSVDRAIAPRSEGILGNHDSGVSIRSTEVPNSTVAGVVMRHSTGLTIQDLTANGSAFGIRDENGSWANLTHNDLASKTVGIYEFGVSGSVLRSNRLYDSPRSIVLVNSTGLSASGDSAEPLQTGIEVVGSNNVTLGPETILGWSSEGLLLDHASQITVRASTLANGSGPAATIRDSTGIGLFGSSLSSASSSAVVVSASDNVDCNGNWLRAAPMPGDAAIASQDDRNLTESANVDPPGGIGAIDVGSSVLQITDNDFSMGSGLAADVQLAGDRAVLVRANHLERSAGEGIATTNGEDVRIEGNDVSQANTTAIQVDNSSAITIQGNDVLHARIRGIALGNASQFSVSGNSGGGIGESVGTGIYGYALTTGTIVDNAIVGANRSVAIVASRSVEIVSNNLSDSVCGLYLVDDLNSTAAGNQLWQDRSIVTVGKDSALWIYHNNFVNDSGWSIGAPRAGVAWDAGYPEGGNYWSNFTGADTLHGPGQNLSGPDGIIDSPFPLEPGVVDRYPLVVPWTGFYLIFTASGLFTPWSIQVNGVNYSSVAPTITVPESNSPNSTFSFFVPLPPGYESVFPQSLGPFPEPRSNATFSISFQPYPPTLYPLTIEEFGLAPGTTWGIVVGAMFYQESVNRFTIPATNASYSYLASAVAGYTLEVGSGDAIVAGSPQSITILYLPVAAPTAQKTSAPSILPSVFAGIGLAIVGVVMTSILLLRKPPARTHPTPPG